MGPRFSRGIRISVNGGEVLVRGRVSSDYEREFVTHTLRQVAGIVLLIDNLELREDQPVPKPRPQVMPAPPRVRRHHVAAAVVITLLAASAWWLPAWLRSGPPRVVAVTGTVRVAGQSPPGALLTLHPLAGPRGAPVHPQGRVDASGRIEWTTFEPGDGVPPGEYVVTAVWNRTVRVADEVQPGPNVLAARYSRPETSPLRLVVKPDATQPIQLELMP